MITILNAWNEPGHPGRSERLLKGLLLISKNYQIAIFNNKLHKNSSKYHISTDVDEKV